MGRRLAKPSNRKARAWARRSKDRSAKVPGPSGRKSLATNPAGQFRSETRQLMMLGARPEAEMLPAKRPKAGRRPMFLGGSANSLHCASDDGDAGDRKAEDRAFRDRNSLHCASDDGERGSSQCWCFDGGQYKTQRGSPSAAT